MNKEMQVITQDVGQLAEDARALLAATADVAGDKVCEARKRLTAALDCAKETCDRVREKAVAGAKVADVTVHEHPYAAMGIAFGLGALIAFLATRRN